MENQTPNNPIMDNQPMGGMPNMGMNQMNKENKGGMGGIIATIVIIALIILGGLYFWGKRMENQRVQENSEETAAVAEAMNTINIGTDDSLDTLEADIGATQTQDIGI